MPPFTESRTASMSQGASSPSAQARPASFQAVLEDVLTTFVTDSMYDKPEDVLLYMQTWALQHPRGKANPGASSEAVAAAAAAAQDRKVSRLSITPSPAAAVAQVTNFTETAEAADPEVDAEAAARLLRLAAQRQQYLRDVAEGCRDHYLMSLDDSDGDMFHLSALQKKMNDARQREANARADNAAVAAQLKAIEESDAPAEQKAQEKATLLREFQERWAADLPPKHAK